MKIAYAIPFLITGLLAIGLSFNDVSAEIAPNNAFILEGSGFAVTEESIKTTEIDFVMSTGDKVGSRTSILVEDGFVTLNEDDFIAIDLTGTALRDDRFIRISGTAEDAFGDEASLRIFGRLIQNSDEGSIYGFTGRFTFEEEEHKIIYTTKLSGLTSISITQETSTEQKSDEILVHILPGASNRGLAADYIESSQLRSEIQAITGDATIRARYFFPDRISIEPGSTITFVNNDDTPHRIVSGTGLGQHSRVSQGAFTICETPAGELPEGFSHTRTGSDCSFTFDGRIDSGEILAGESWTNSFDDAGFYRIIDPNYPWMNTVIYTFPDTGSEIIRKVGTDQSGN